MSSSLSLDPVGKIKRVRSISSMSIKSSKSLCLTTRLTVLSTPLNEVQTTLSSPVDLRVPTAETFSRNTVRIVTETVARRTVVP